MSNVWFCSDLHLGHKNVGKFRQPCGIYSEQENFNRIFADWEVVVPRDIVYMLGDIVFTMEALTQLDFLSGTKILVRGNHDTLDTSAYMKKFKDIYGLLKYKHLWLSHAPIHPDELRGRHNLHGHVHFNSVPDNRYLNCCPENLWPKYGRCLVSLQEVQAHFKELNVV